MTMDTESRIPILLTDVSSETNTRTTLKYKQTNRTQVLELSRIVTQYNTVVYQVTTKIAHCAERTERCFRNSSRSLVTNELAASFSGSGRLRELLFLRGGLRVQQVNEFFFI